MKSLNVIVAIVNWYWKVIHNSFLGGNKPIPHKSSHVWDNFKIIRLYFNRHYNGNNNYGYALI